MKFIVEDGTGLPLANAFIPVSFVDEYAEEMGKADVWGVAFDSEGLPLPADQLEKRKQQAIIQASRWISGNFVWKGTPCSPSQGLAFPRDAITEGAIRQFPFVVREATASAAIRVFSGVILNKDSARGGAIKRVKAGPVEVEYADNAPTDTIYTEIENMLRDLALGLGGTEFITTAVRI